MLSALAASLWVSLCTWGTPGHPASLVAVLPQSWNRGQIAFCGVFACVQLLQQLNKAASGG